MCNDKAMYIEWILLMNTLESRDRLDKLNIEELKKVYYLCRLKQLDDEMEEIR